MSSIINRIITLFQNKQMYISMGVIALLLFLFSLLQKNNILTSITRMFIGTVIIVVLVTIVWVVLSIIIEPVLAADKEENGNDKGVSSSTSNETNASNIVDSSVSGGGRELGVASDEIDLNEINNASADIGNFDTVSSNEGADEAIKSTINENKDIDNSTESLYHERDTKPVGVGANASSKHDSGSIDFIFSSNDDNDKDVEISLPEQTITASNDSGIAGFDDFGDPAIVAQAIRTVRSKDDEKGRT